MRILLFIFLQYRSLGICAQDLKQVRLSLQERKTVKAHYQHESEAGRINLYLYRNGKFEYYLNSHLYGRMSVGKWFLKNNILILISDIPNDNLPVKVNYIKNMNDTTTKRKVLPPKNLNGQEVPSALTNINNDSIQCLDGNALCIRDYLKIDSIKVIMESGIHSKWLHIEDNNDAIELVIQTTLDLEVYEDLRNEKYLVKKNILILKK